MATEKSTDLSQIKTINTKILLTILLYTHRIIIVENMYKRIVLIYKILSLQ